MNNRGERSPSPRRRAPSPGSERFIPHRRQVGTDNAWLPFRAPVAAEQADDGGHKQDESYDESVAEALGIARGAKALGFSPERRRSPEWSSPARAGDTTSPKHREVKRPKPLSNIPFRILDAPGLRNDFYSNLVSWSRFSTHLIVGLGRDVHVWLPSDGARLANVTPAMADVTFVEFAYNSVAAIGHSDGLVTFYDVLQNQELETYEHQRGVLCAVWCPNNTDIFIGDDIGTVLHLALTAFPAARRYIVQQFPSLVGHTDQICGIALSPNLSHLAVGSNDNYVSIWELNGGQQTARFKIKHNSAVKALAFCPWQASLLATGGGTYDKTIRFWHCQSGTLIHSQNLHGQITGIVWSEQYRQICVTIGFGKRQSSPYVGVYSYPRLQLLAHVPHMPGVRALSVASSCDRTSIVIASSDQTVRFYQIWDQCTRRVCPWYGILGSDILEFLEGRDNDSNIR